MNEIKETLINYGGHEMAGGFSLEKNNLKNFEIALQKYSKEKIVREIKIPDEDLGKNILKNNFINLKIEDITKELFQDLQIFAPFGIENEKIIFRVILDNNNKIKFKKFGKESEHLEILINNKIRGIEFFVGKERVEELKKQKEFLINLE